MFDVVPSDLKRLWRRVVRLHVVQPTLLERLAGSRKAALATRWTEAAAGPLANWKFNQCVMLRGSPMHRVSCRIYDKRPAICRSDIRPGDRACIAKHEGLENHVVQLFNRPVARLWTRAAPAR